MTLPPRNAYISLLSLILCACPRLSSAAAATDPIDANLDKCLASDSTTAHQVECAYAAYEAWDSELNKNYKALVSELRPKAKSALKASQRIWLQYRDSEFSAIDALYYTELEGTMYHPMRVADRAEVVKQRALQLRGYLALMRTSR